MKPSKLEEILELVRKDGKPRVWIPQKGAAPVLIGGKPMPRGPLWGGQAR